MINDSDWEDFIPEGDDYIPVSDWGQDHWSVFAYLETCVIDHAGIVDNRRMRCNSRLHRTLANLNPWGQVIEGAASPTRLRHGVLDKHDDWSCLEDIIYAGYMTAQIGIAYPTRVFGSDQARVQLTPAGWRIAHALREFRGSGGNFREFTFEETANDR